MTYYNELIATVAREDIKVRLWVKNNKLFYTVPKSEYRWAGLIPESSFDEVNDQWSAPLDYRVILQLKLFFNTKINIMTDWLGRWYLEQRRRERDINQPLEIKTESPLARLRNYQVAGCSFMAKAGRTLNADDVGLGKTAQAIAAVEMSNSNCALVVCPGILKSNWAKEIRAWAPGRTVGVIGGDRKSRVHAIQNFEDGYLIIGVETIRLHPELSERVWDWLIIDEAHRIKNLDAQQTKAVFSVPSNKLACLTATPILNRTNDLWTLLNLIDPVRFNNQEKFVDYYSDPSQTGKWTERSLQLVSTLSPYAVRRTKDECLPELPPVTCETITLKMDGMQQHFYDNMKVRLRVHWHGKTVTALEVLSQMTRLRQLACSPMTLGLDEPGVKFEMVRMLVEDCEDTRIGIFTTFAEAARKLGDYLRDEIEDSERVMVITGQTSRGDREKFVNRYRDEENAVLIATIQLLGTGVNLQAGHEMIILDKPWSPVIVDQLIGRMDRMGQEFPVTVKSLVIAGSVDERMEVLLENKDRLIKPTVAAMEMAQKERLIYSDNEIVDLDVNAALLPELD